MLLDEPTTVGVIYENSNKETLIFPFTALVNEQIAQCELILGTKTGKHTFIIDEADDTTSAFSFARILKSGGIFDGVVSVGENGTFFQTMSATTPGLF